MVVLSACETANGQFLKGEGIISITRAFTHAGTKSAVTSIWPMEDQLTSRLMLNFHKELKQGLNKSEALRNAKLNYLAETPGFQSHPFFWGGIIAIGDMSPID
jgi:CHAT domain-containing protein